MSRSSRKGPYVEASLLKKIAGLKPGDKTVIKTWARHSSVAPEMVGFVFGVHNGKDFIEVRVTEEMVGHKFGEFATTRKFIRHGGKMQKELEKGVGAPVAPAPADKTSK
ncbi:MAG TPA: 30S ribosomal protein S19 [Candidatus Colwellbacteria bacterium]|jgi:small subunit ribosomal protein S19|nr:30S ribosomal protein S19 [Candidatus Colwellbacteria bacterium]